jgi:uncharacterized BrkB/YihY/UPF0761 family membrane protein
MRFIKVFGKSITAFFRDDCFYLAASIAYFLILSMVPLSLLIIALYGHIMGESEEVYRFSLSRLISFFPSVTSGITNELENIITFKGISWITIFIYGFLSIQLFSSLERAMDVIFKAPKRRHFLLFLLWTTQPWLSSSCFIGVHSRVRSGKYFGLEIGYKAAIFLKYIAPFLLVLSTFTAIYKIVQGKISERCFYSCYRFVGICKTFIYMGSKKCFLHRRNIRLTDYIYSFSSLDVLYSVYFSSGRRVCKKF